MSLIYFKPIHDGRDGDAEQTSRGTVVRYTRVWRARTNNPYDDAVVVCATVGADGNAAPKLGSYYPYDPRATLRRLSPKQSKGKLLWTVMGHYSTEASGEPPQENPLAEPAKIKWRTDHVQRPLYFDKDGYGIVNKAGDPFIPPVVVNVQFWTASVQKNVMMVPAWLDYYRNSTNSDTFFIQGRSFTAGHAHLDEIEISDRQVRNNIQYYTLSMQIQTLDTFSVQVLNHGFNELKDDVLNDPDEPTSGYHTEVRPIYLGDGTRPQVPLLLDTNGKRIENPSPSDAITLSFDWLVPQPYSALPLY